MSQKLPLVNLYGLTYWFLFMSLYSFLLFILKISINILNCLLCTTSAFVHNVSFFHPQSPCSKTVGQDKLHKRFYSINFFSMSILELYSPFHIFVTAWQRSKPLNISSFFYIFCIYTVLSVLPQFCLR